MRILLLGATGRTGKLVLKKALEKGYQVNCLARNSQRIDEEEGLTIIEGNPNKEADLQKAINNCEAIISVLNISRKSDFPWSGLRTPKNY
ncbi:MAG: NAD(P)H-binding protein, partial [Bacteroidetes bacterium]|nr:NAD(P)H-binding protein [Bacteroidota bacterium]